MRQIYADRQFHSYSSGYGGRRFRLSRIDYHEINTRFSIRVDVADRHLLAAVLLREECNSPEADSIHCRKCL